MKKKPSLESVSIPYFVSWSGGKDSSLALYKATQKYGKPKVLLTMMTENGQRSRSHGLSRELLEQQAACLQIPIRFFSASWTDYEKVYLQAVESLAAEGIKMGVFGDIKVKDDPQWTSHREFADKMCASQNMTVFQPLWDEEYSIIDEFFKLGFEATIIAINEQKINVSYLGMPLTIELIQELSSHGVNQSGEKGEYHTVVTNGPNFYEPLKVMTGIKVLKDGYWFIDVETLPGISNSM